MNSRDRIAPFQILLWPYNSMGAPYIRVGELQSSPYSNKLMPLGWAPMALLWQEEAMEPLPGYYNGAGPGNRSFPLQ
jgi:hypothetical protein